ncbi:hypothetical protein BLNAU_21271 [Blattamonas nauphoetae]|uniref:Uncharacterized protein n=1 Tax=Blattamonas nauphoetae TaxID=2049346 RepID=A0ABQ9WWZ1_9EUKA|nr:hypothetical protein BLNAU_21271 [Blattamonas nauphoetae]
MQRKTYFELHDATVVRPLSTAPAFSSQNQPLITILRSRFVTNKTAPRRPLVLPVLLTHSPPLAHRPFRAVLSSLFVFLCSATVLTASIQAASLRIELTTSATYTNDVFINIVAPVEPVDPAEPVEPVDPAEPVDPVEPVVTSGGAIHCTGGTLTLEKCHFENVSSGTMGDGGAVFSSGDEVKADHCVFLNCRGRNGGAIFCGLNTKLTVLSSQFEKCYSTIGPCSGEFSGDSHNTAQHANGGGGALYIHLKEGHHIVDSLFQDCTAPSFGGGIFVDNAADPKILPYYFKFAFCMFIGTKVNETKGQSNSGGHVMFVKVATITNGQDKNDETTIPDFFKGKNADGKSRVEGVATDSISGETHNIRFGKASNQNLDNKFLAQNPIVSITGSDSPTCGSEESPCRTVSNAGLFIKTGYTIRVQEGDFKTEGSNDENNVFVASRKITIEGQGKREGDTGTKVEFTSPAYSAAIFVTTGSATLSKMTLQLSALSSEGWNLVEVDTGGTVQINNCALVGKGSAQNGRLVNVVSGSLTVTQSSFSSIHSNLDKGAAISASVSSSSSVSISSSSFTSCKLSDGSGVGGAIHLFLEADTADFVLSDLQFTSNATKAKDVFISAADLSLDKKVLTAARFAVEWEDNPADNARFRCESRGGDYGIVELGIPEYLVQLMTVNVDASQPNDAAGCGKDATPCQSIRGAANQLINTELNGHFVVVVGAGLLNGDVTVKSSSFRPKADIGSAAIQLKAAHSLTCSGSVKFTRIAFTFTENVASQTPTLLNLTSGKLTLTGCTFKSHTDGTQVKANQLVSVSETGTIVADELKATDLSFSSTAFAIESDTIEIGSVTLFDCEFTGTPTAAFVSLTSKSTSSRLSVGPISFGSSNADPTPTTTLVEIKAPKTATIESTATLFTATSSSSFTSNAKISTTETPAEVVSILKILSGPSFRQTLTSRTIHFAAGTDASSTASFVDTSFVSLVLADTTIDVSSLTGFFSQAVFAVKANPLSISFTTLSEVLSDVSGMTCPLATVAGGSLTFSKVKIDGTALPLSFDKSVIVQTGGTVQLTESTFTQITSTSSGAAVHSTLTASGHSLTITSCGFAACSSNGNGGAMNVNVVAGSFVISTQTTTFSKCSSVISNGGAISLDLTGLSGGTFNLAGVSFGTGNDANSCGSGKSGKDVFMHGDFTSFNDKSPFPSAYSASPINEDLKESIAVSSTHTTLTLSLLQYLHSPTTEGFVDDTTDAADINQCGHHFVNCKTLSQLKQNAPSLSSVKIVSALTIKTDFPVIQTVTITSKDELPRSSLVLVSTPSLSVTSSTPTLTLTNLAISTASSSSPQNSDTTYLLIASGKLVVSQSTFTSSASLPCPLIYAKTTGALEIEDFNATTVPNLNDVLIRGQTSATMKVTSSNFKSLTRTTTEGMKENGTVISAVLDGITSFKLDTLTFDTCGTAVFLNMEGCSPTLDYSVHNVAFTTTTQSQLYIIGDDLSRLLNTSRWTDLPQVLPDETHEIFMTHSTTYKHTASLRTYLVPFEGTVYLSSEGSDFPLCGQEESSACLSLDMAFTRHSGDYPINCRDKIQLGNGDVTLDSKVTISGSSSESGLEFKTGQTLFCEGSDGTETSRITFSNLKFALGSTAPTGSVIVRSGNVAFDTIILSQSLTIPAIQTYPGSTTTLTNVLLLLETFSAFPFDFQGTVSLTDTNQASSPKKYLTHNGGDGAGLTLTALTFSPSSFSHSFSSFSQRNDAAVCSWAEGAITLINTQATVSLSNFTGFTDGVFSITGGDTTFTNCSFRNNFVDSSSSFQRNFVCSQEGVLHFDNSTANTFRPQPSEEISFWMSADGCEVSVDENIYKHPVLFFPTSKEPQITQVVNDVIKAKQQVQSVLIEGSNFFNCELSLAVFQGADYSTSPKKIAIPLTSQADQKDGVSDFVHNETSISFVFSPTAAKVPTSCTLYLGFVSNDVCIKSSFFLTVKLAQFNQSQLTFMTIVLPIIIVVAVVLVIFIIILCVRRRNKNKKKDDEEMIDKALLNDQSTVLQESSEEQLDVDMGDTYMTAQKDSEFDHNPFKGKLQPILFTQPNHTAVTGLSRVSVLSVVCSGPDYPFAFADRRMTLSERIHGTGKVFEDQDAEGVVIGTTNEETEAKPVFSTSLSTSDCITIATRVAQTMIHLKKEGKAQGKFPEFTIRNVSPLSILVYPDMTVLLALPDAYVRTLNITLPLRRHRQWVPLHARRDSGRVEMECT